MGMTGAQYTQELRALLPPGRALDDNGAGTLSQLLDGLAQELARVDASAGNLIDESIPTTTLQLLPDWERVCDLPDNCTPAGQSITARRQAVTARLLGNGTPSIPYLEDVAAQIGYSVTVNRCHARRSGSLCGTSYGGIAWQFTWEVHAALNTLQQRFYGGAIYGTPYASWQNAVLECVMRQHAPAHTIVHFIYS